MAGIEGNNVFLCWNMNKSCRNFPLNKPRKPIMSHPDSCKRRFVSVQKCVYSHVSAFISVDFLPVHALFLCCWLQCFCLFNRTMWEWSSSSKGKRGEASTRFITLMLSVQMLTSLYLCRILQFPRPVKLDDLRAKAKVAFGQTMDLHYTNNEV